MAEEVRLGTSGLATSVNVVEFAAGFEVAMAQACQTAPNIFHQLECAPEGGHFQAAVVTVWRACCSSNCTGLR